MDTLIINVSWEYFLGVMGGLIAVAYYSNGRFRALETNVEWLKELLTDLLLDSENERAKLFKNNSALSLTPKGYHALARSGLRSYIDANKRQLLSHFSGTDLSDPYELQRYAFRLLAEFSFEDPVERHLNRFAFTNGVSTFPSGTATAAPGTAFLYDLLPVRPERAAGCDEVHLAVEVGSGDRPQGQRRVVAGSGQHLPGAGEHKAGGMAHRGLLVFEQHRHHARKAGQR